MSEIFLTLPELECLNDANSLGILVWIYSQLLSHSDEVTLLPVVWRIMEERIQKHPSEPREEGGHGTYPPIHDVLHYSWYLKTNEAAPLSLINLLIKLHPEGLCVQDESGRIPLHHALIHPSTDCFRAVLYGGSSVEATTTVQDNEGWTPLHWSTEPDVPLIVLWELLYYNRECVNIQDILGKTALECLAQCQVSGFQVARQKAKTVFVKMAQNYNHVPDLPSDEEVAVIESHFACTVLAQRLELLELVGNDDFILHQALEAKFPRVLLEALIQIFPHQVEEEYTFGRLPLHIALQSNLGASVRLLAAAYPAAMFIPDPVTGLLPIEKAMLNLANDGSLHNTDGINALLQANPAFLERID